MKPPYDAFSWPFSQHAIALKPNNFFGLLDAAFRFQGTEGKSSKISEYLVKGGILTANLRKDSEQADAWRDYQQVLPELGFIISTSIQPAITLTPMGLLLLDGSIGVREAFTNQALRYQYPNGFKWDLSPKVRETLTGRDREVGSLTELHATKKVLVKPAVLLLRVLLQLITDKQEPKITVDESQGFLLPLSKNADWRLGYEQLLRSRRGRLVYPKFGSRRNVQDWYKFLAQTDVFRTAENDDLRLTFTGSSNLENLEKICSAQEDPSTFWIPGSFSDPNKLRQSWFRHFGAYSIDSQWVLPEPTQEYLENNYPAGVEPSETGGISSELEWKISLKEFDEESERNKYQDRNRLAVGESLSPEEKRKLILERSRLHQHILVQLSRKLKSNGFEVFSSKGGADESADLVAAKDRSTSVIEVKTITNRNWRSRLRLGVGQLSEYRYRYQKEHGKRPNALLVVSSEAKFAPWLLDYLQDDAEMSLVGYGESGFVPYTKVSIEKSLAG